MTTERKRWWRKVAAVAVGGSVVAFGIVRATAQPQNPAPAGVEDTTWSRSSTPAPSVSEIERSDAPTGGVVQASATFPIPTSTSNPVAPVVPVMPPAPFPAGLEPTVPGPRLPDAGVAGSDKNMLPAVPPLPSVELPKVPAVPTAPITPPASTTVFPQPPVAAGLPLSPPAPGGLPEVPPLPSSTAEPPKAPVVPVPPAPMLPGLPAIPQPVGITPSLPSVQFADPVQPMLPMKPDSGLNPTIPGNTLNPASPVAPALPIAFPPTSPGGRETPGRPVDRPKPPEPSFGSTDKFVFPGGAGSNSPSLTPREAAMINFKHTAALAIIGGAMLTAEQARSAAVFPPITPMVPVVPVKADDPGQLKKDLEEANKKIAKLDEQVKKLTELLVGKRDELGLPIPSDPGAVEEIKQLKNRIAQLETDLKTLKTQTSLKPSIVPEVKPKGIVKVVNEYPVEIRMVINDKSYHIAPNTKIEVEVPAGDFSYQLLQSGAATRSVIKDKETVTLRIK